MAAKTWFQSEREKRNVQKNALKAMEAAEMDLMDKGSHKRAGKRKQQASGPDRLPDSKRTRRKLAMERFYAKEREGDDGDASRGIRVTKGVKSIKSLEREARLTGGVASKVVRMARNARDPKTKAKRRAAAAADDDDDPRFQSSGRGAGFRGKFRSTGANTNANAKPFKATKGKFKSASKYKRKK